MTQPYTNIAAGYAVAPGAGKGDFNLDSWNRFSADHPHIGMQQFKVMTQQLKAWNPTFANSGRDYANPALISNVMKGKPGMYSPHNPFGRYQGTQGNFGSRSLTDAYNAGALPMDNPGAIPGMVAQGGMFMPHGATQMWQNMMFGHHQQKQWEQMMAAIPTAEDIMAMMPQYDPPEPVGHGQAYSTGGSMMQGLQAATPDKFDTEGGGSTTQHQFGQGQQYTGSMNIAGHGDVKPTSGTVFGQGLNVGQTEFDKKQYQIASAASGNALSIGGLNKA